MIKIPFTRKPSLRERWALNVGHPQLNTCLAWWPLLERSGARTFPVVGKDIGIFTDGATWQNDAALFDASSENVDFGDVTFLDGLTECSASLWVYMNSSVANARILSKGGNNAAQQSFGIMTGAGRQLRIVVSDGGARVVVDSGTTTLPLGEWFHLFMNWYGTNQVSAWLNGAPVSLGYLINDTPDSINSTTGTLRLADDSSSGSSTLDGMIRDVRIYSKPKSLDQILELYKNPWEAFERRMWVPGSAGAAAYTLDTSTIGLSITPQSVDVLQGYKVQSASVSLTITPQDVDVLQGYEVQASSVAVSISAQDVDFLRDYVLQGESVNLPIAGQDVSLLADRLLQVASQGLSIAPQDVDVLIGRALLTDSIAVSITPQDITLTYDSGELMNYLLETNSVSLSITPQSVSVVYDHKLQAQSVTLTIDPKDVGLLKDSVLPSDSVSITLTAQDVDNLYGRESQSDSASLGITPNAVGMLRSRLLAADSKAITITPQDVGFLLDRQIGTENVNLGVSAQVVNLTYSGANPSSRKVGTVMGIGATAQDSN